MESQWIIVVVIIVITIVSVAVFATSAVAIVVVVIVIKLLAVAMRSSGALLLVSLGTAAGAPDPTTTCAADGVFARARLHHGKPAVEVGNAALSLTVLTGGGHIARAAAPGVALNPLWTPSWETVPPSLRRLAARNGSAFSQVK